MAKGGRPTDYRDEYAGRAEKLTALGATDIEVADFFEVDVRTIYRWKHTHPKFCQSLNTGKDKADERVINSLYQRAIGYEQDAVKIFMPANAPAPVYAPYREKVAPDTTAAIFWLKNRRSKEWRDKQELEHSGLVQTGLNVDALAALPEEQLEQLRSLLVAVSEEPSGSD